GTVTPGNARSDSQPEERAADRDDGGVVSKRLLVAGREPARLLEQTEGALDLRPGPVLLLVVGGWIDPRSRRGDHRLAGQLAEQGTEGVGAVCLVGEQAPWTRPLHQAGCGHDVVTMTLGDRKGERDS